MMQRVLAPAVAAVLFLIVLRLFPAPRANALGPSVTVAHWDRINGCVTPTKWIYGIEDLVKQTLPNEWYDSDPAEALRAGASVIRQDYWYFQHHNDAGVRFCVTPYPYDMRDSRMAFIQGSAGINSAKATDDTVIKGWAPYGSATANDMFLSFGSSLQRDTGAQALSNYLWTQIVASASWPPGEWAPNACCPGGSGNIGVVTPLGSACLYDCTADYDGDGVVNFYDNCPFAPNASQTNTDGNNAALGRPGYDNFGDACDANISGDGYTNAQHTALGKNPALYCYIMRADINGDGTVDINDLSIAAGYFLNAFTHNDYPPNGVDTGIQRVDQDGDNLISISDLAVLGGYFLQSVTACP